MDIQNIEVYEVEESPFLYILSDSLSKDTALNAFDIRNLHNWGWNPNTKSGQSRALHANVIREALYHGHLNDYLKKNNLQFRTM